MMLEPPYQSQRGEEGSSDVTSWSISNLYTEVNTILIRPTIKIRLTAYKTGLTLTGLP